MAKSPTDFNECKRAPDGRQYKCRDCSRKLDQAYRESNTARNAVARDKPSTLLKQFSTSKCGRCKTIKPITEFHRNRHTANGINNWCGECRRSATKVSKSTPKHRLTRNAYARQYKKHRRGESNKIKIRGLAQTALKQGRLTKQPCIVCATTVNVQAHHSDYSKPLDVDWLCTKHHATWHKYLTPYDETNRPEGYYSLD